MQLESVIKKIPIAKRLDRIFWKYLLISVVATLVDVWLLYCLTEFGKLNYMVSATISFCSGVIVAYAGQKLFTFKDESKKITRQFTVFAMVSVIGLLINLAVLKVCVDVFGLYYLLGKLIAIGFGFVWNYSVNKRVTFKDWKDKNKRN